MPSIPYQRSDEKSRPGNEKVDNNSIKFAGSSHASHASPHGELNVTQPLGPLPATVTSDKYANGEIGITTGTGDVIPRSAQQICVPPSNNQYNKLGGGIPAQGPQAPGPSSRPEFNQGESGTKVHSDSSPRQTISGCFKPKVTNDNSFNDNYYHRQVINNDNRKGAKKGRRSKKRQQESSSESSSDSD